jgi:hypothetical protein
MRERLARRLPAGPVEERVERVERSEQRLVRSSKSAQADKVRVWHRDGVARCGRTAQRDELLDESRCVSTAAAAYLRSLVVSPAAATR